MLRYYILFNNYTTLHSILNKEYIVYITYLIIKMERWKMRTYVGGDEEVFSNANKKYY